MTDSPKLTSEERLLAAIAYGESSTRDQYEEMAALASVMVRQMKARGYSSIDAFTSKDKNFSFVRTDGNARYAKLMKSTEKDAHLMPSLLDLAETPAEARHALLLRAWQAAQCGDPPVVCSMAARTGARHGRRQPSGGMPDGDRPRRRACPVALPRSPRFRAYGLATVA